MLSKEGIYTGTYQRNDEHDVERKECESRNPDVLGGREFLLRGLPKSLYPPHPRVNSMRLRLIGRQGLGSPWRLLRARLNFAP